MKKIDSIIKENKDEALEIIEKFGGKILFHADAESDDFLLSDYDLIVPVVCREISDGDLCPVAIVGVKIAQPNDTLYFLAVHLEYEDEMEWFPARDCAFDSENDVYLYLGEHYEKSNN